MSPSSWSSRLRAELARLARKFAEEERLPFYESLGTSPTVLFEPFADGARHGNFLDASYAAIRRQTAWKARLLKVHPGQRATPKSSPPRSALSSAVTPRRRRSSVPRGPSL